METLATFSAGDGASKGTESALKDVVSYVPIPWITFLVDQAEICCGLCFDTKLNPLRWEVVEDDDSTPVLLPCGHIFGSLCLSRWRKANKGKANCMACPLCKQSYKYELCGHTVSPKFITLGSIYNLPSPLSEAEGILPAQCHECRAEVSHSLARDNIDLNTAEFDRLRIEFRDTQSKVAEARLKRKADILVRTLRAFVNQDRDAW